MPKPVTGVAICHYGRSYQLKQVVEAVLETVSSRIKVIVCDDGTPNNNTDSIWGPKVHEANLCAADICRKLNVPYIQGPNKGVAYNKNRALFVLQDCDYVAILEDDIYPTEPDWITVYETAAQYSGIAHWCRVTDKQVPTLSKPFDECFERDLGERAIYGSSPRGDFTFIHSSVIKVVGGFDTRFQGAGYAHGEWSSRVWRAGLIRHPNKWIDIDGPSKGFQQIGDTEGGRWDYPEKTANDLQRNKRVLEELKNEGIYRKLTFC